MVLTNQLIYLVNVKTMRKIFSNYVCFSESPNFKWEPKSVPFNFLLYVENLRDCGLVYFSSGWVQIKKSFWNFPTFKVNDSKLEDKKKETFITEAEKKLQEAKKNKSKLRILLFF